MGNVQLKLFLVPLVFSFLFFHFIFAVPPMEIFPGGSGLSPSKEVNRGDIIIMIIIVIMTVRISLIA